jgi:hypothetical protein
VDVAVRVFVQGRAQKNQQVFWTSRGEHRRKLIYTQTFKLAARDPAVVEGGGKKSNKIFEEDRAFQT